MCAMDSSPHSGRWSAMFPRGAGQCLHRLGCRIAATGELPIAATPSCGSCHAVARELTFPPQSSPVRAIGSGWTALRGEGQLGYQLIKQLSDLVALYNDEMDARVEWATDWSRADDEFDWVTVYEDEGASAPPALFFASGTVDKVTRRLTGAYKHVKKLMPSVKNEYRRHAREHWKGKHQPDHNHHIHNRTPLEYAHIVRKDPNAFDNLYMVRREVHTEMHRRWTQFRVEHKKPTKRQVEQFAEELDKEFGGRMIDASNKKRVQ